MKKTHVCVRRSVLCLFMALLAPEAGLAQEKFSKSSLIAKDVAVPTLVRAAIFLPARYRVVFIPGSGCTNMAPIAEKYFAALLHAELLVLHKPGVDLNGLNTQPNCSESFAKWDALSNWSEAAQKALEINNAVVNGLPQILVGVSEGAEIVADVAAKIDNLHAIVLIGASGLDPRVAGEMQAKRRGEQRAWRRLEQAVFSASEDAKIVDGRTLRYWRDLWSWQVSKPLLAIDKPVMQVWGGNDALVPSEAYAAFAAIAAAYSKPQTTKVQLCVRKLEGVDHGLQSLHRDGVQWVWAQLENWARSLKTTNANLCTGLTIDSINQ